MPSLECLDCRFNTKCFMKKHIKRDGGCPCAGGLAIIVCCHVLLWGYNTMCSHPEWDLIFKPMINTCGL